MEDARTDKSLLAAFESLGNTVSLADFMAAIPALGTKDKLRIIDQAEVLIGQLYTHLPLKRSMHAVDPLQSLKLLRRRLETIDDRAFHSKIIEIFKGLRDGHTNYGLPAPYEKRLAFLPFLFKAYYDNGQRRFLVSHLLFRFEHATFKPGVELTHWNGTPIELAVRANADKEEGSNPAARFAFGLRSMTVRSLGSSLPPEEEWVALGYRATSGATKEIILPWRIWDTEHDPRPDLSDVDSGTLSAEQLALGISIRTHKDHRARKILFAPKAMEMEERLDPVGRMVASAKKSIGDLDLGTLDFSAVDLSKESVIPNVLEFNTITSDARDYGYIKIRTFAHREIGQFINEFIRILDLMPKSGLILDVRSNGGGIIFNGEFLLQFLTPRHITPEPFHFINTALTQEVCTVPGGLPQDVANARSEMEKNWGDSIGQAIETGAIFSKGVPLTPEKACNLLGQIYHGPTVLITDAECFSTTDIFAAGFQDHEIGLVLGVDENTGAGGANVWTHKRALELLPGTNSLMQPLPNGASMRVAIRRCTRVGPNHGQPVEDLGVKPDKRHHLTHDDLLHDDKDLFDEAIKLLKPQTGRQLDASFSTPVDGELPVVVVTANVDRLDFYVNDRPTLTLEVEDGQTAVNVPLLTADPARLEIRGFEQDNLVAARKLNL